MTNAIIIDEEAQVVIVPQDDSSVAVVDNESSVVVLTYDGPPGAKGAAGAQDFGWSLSTSLGAGEVFNGLPLPHPATYNKMYAHTDTGVTAPRVFTINQKRANVVIASASMTINPGQFDVEHDITPLAFLAGDVPVLVMPNPQDGQLADIALSVGSTP